MLLTLTTTHDPATDIGYLLHKNPFRCYSFSLPFGTAHVFFPEATTAKCTLAVLLDVDPVELVRNRHNPQSTLPLDQYVNDRPYVCSSFMSVVLSRVFGQALNGRCKERPELVNVQMPLTCRLAVLPCRGGEPFLRKLFEPLGYEVSSQRHPLDPRFPAWGESPYHTVDLAKTTTVTEFLNHLYVLIPVLDNQKHYYVDESEIDKLIKRGEGWLSSHPEKEPIARRFLKNRTSYLREALDRLMEAPPSEDEEVEERADAVEGDVESRLNLNEERLGSVLAALKSAGAASVVDLGCGEGKLLRLLLKEKQFRRIVGLDVSIRSLEKASDRLNLPDLPPLQKDRIQLIHGSLMYRDRRLEGFDAAAIVEVIEHLDQPRLLAFERVVFEFAKPKVIVLTTPNREYNVVWENIGPDKLRHGDHRFEWTRAEFYRWAGAIAERYGYSVRFLPLGNEAPDVGAPTQMAIFSAKPAVLG